MSGGLRIGTEGNWTPGLIIPTTWSSELTTAKTFLTHDSTNHTKSKGSSPQKPTQISRTSIFLHKEFTCSNCWVRGIFDTLVLIIL